MGDRCEPVELEPCGDDRDCLDGSGLERRCAFRSTAGVGVCLAVDQALCCGVDADCPADTPFCFDGAYGPNAGACVDRTADYCVADAELSAAGVVRCHTDAAGERVSWRAGDCDGDGFPNGLELEVGADPCRAERGQIKAAPELACEGPLPGCDAVGDGCAVDGRDGTCREVGPEAVCVLDRRPFCCDQQAALACPPDRRCVLHRAEQGFCVDPGVDLCDPVPSPARLLSCHTAPGGERPVRYPAGDCDQDGRANEAELARGTNPCVPEPFAPDAGPLDAGAGGDLGLGDAGPPEVQLPSFDGGAGCTCRIGPTRRGAPAVPLALGLACLGLGLAIRRRERRR
ncbi:MAG: hypothetical protein ACFCGT_05470 [Sandaracinaceae bacterium]